MLAWGWGLGDCWSAGAAAEGQYVQSVDDSGNVTQDREQDVDEEISSASSLKEDS